MEKAVIMARGLGTRMRAANPQAELDSQQAAVASTGIKALMPIGRPFIDYALGALADAGYRRVCLIIGPEHDALREYCTRELDSQRLRVECAVQQEPRGTADAVLAAEEFAAEDPFTIVNSDNYYPVEALAGLRSLSGPGLAVFSREGMMTNGNIPAERILKFAIAEADENGFLRRIVEKPDEAALQSLQGLQGVSMNSWRFDRRIFAACRAIEPSARGELELPDAVQYAIDNLGVRFAMRVYHQTVLDLSSQGDIASVKRLLSGVEVRL